MSLSHLVLPVDDAIHELQDARNSPYGFAKRYWPDTKGHFEGVAVPPSKFQSCVATHFLPT